MRLLTNLIARWFKQPPADIVAAFNAVNSGPNRMSYVYYKSSATRVKTDGIDVWVWDEKRPEGLKKNYGNCVAFAQAYKQALSRGTLQAIKLWNGEWHCVLDVKNGQYTWRLDCRKKVVELIR